VERKRKKKKRCQTDEEGIAELSLAMLPIERRPNTVQRSRSKEECASRLEDDDEEGDEAAEDSAPAGAW
jgi:hypothetical protein